MTDVDWTRVRAVFEDACDVADADRDEFVARICADEPAVADEVRELLGASAAAADTIEPPTGATLAGSIERVMASGSDATPSRIGAYRIGPVIAAGGMGVVFAAEQERPRRRVALKMLRLGFDSDDAARRFRYESEVLASLRHPGIAQVYEAGVHHVGGDPPRELPWFAMEFVEGATTILAFADDRGLDWRARLELFGAVCAAVQHGHQRGVVHRDLKPDNILVDRTGQVKVIDFGVARMLDADPGLTTPYTEAGKIVGTLQYMSPEQLAGARDDVDTRSDVFALGVVLFELLTGHLPHDVTGKAIHEVAAAVRDRSPPRLREFVPELAGDLELIVGMALAKDPERRYPSASALGDDLGRFVRGEGIVARPPSLAYQARLFGRRHRALVSGALAVAAFGVVATAVSVSAAVDAAAARASSDEMFRRFVARALEQTFEFAPRIHRLPGAAPISTDMIARTITDLEMLLREPQAGGGMRADLAIAYTRLGEVQGLATSPNIGDVDAAGESFRTALRIADELVAGRPGDPRARYARSRALRALGQWHAQVGESDEALALLTDAVAAAEGLSTDEPEDREAGVASGYAHEMLARTLYARDALDDADRHCGRASEVFAALYAAYPDDEEIEFRYVTSRNAMVNSFYRRGLAAENGGRPDDARAWYAKSRAQSRGTIAEIEGHYGNDLVRPEARIWLAGGLRWAGSMSLLLDELDQAEAELGGALAYYRVFASADPDDPRWPPVIGDVLTSLGNVARTRAQGAAGAAEQQRHWSAARELYAESLAQFEALEAAGQLRGPRAALPDDVRARLESCDAALRALAERR